MEPHWYEYINSLDYTLDRDMQRGGTVNKKKIAENKFYVGSNSIFDRNWGHATVEDAIEHAKTLINTREGTDSVFIVEIVRVVKLDKPVVVEEV